MIKSTKKRFFKRFLVRKFFEKLIKSLNMLYLDYEDKKAWFKELSKLF